MRSIFSFSLVIMLILISCQQDPSREAPRKEVPSTVSLPAEPVSNPIPPCPDDMVYVSRGNFCIDKYEWPNKQGEYPESAMTAYQAESLCLGINKRLCTHTEWNFACRGKNNLPYGYGILWEKEYCNDHETKYIPVNWKLINDPVKWKIYAKTLYKGTPSGSKSLCCSEQNDDKVYDMIGNVREWVKDPHGLGGYSFESSFWHGTMSGPIGCGFTVRGHSPSFPSYEVGTRCCKDSN